MIQTLRGTSFRLLVLVVASVRIEKHRIRATRSRNSFTHTETLLNVAFSSLSPRKRYDELLPRPAQWREGRGGGGRIRAKCMIFFSRSATRIFESRDQLLKRAHPGNQPRKLKTKFYFSTSYFFLVHNSCILLIKSIYGYHENLHKNAELIDFFELASQECA